MADGRQARDLTSDWAPARAADVLSIELGDETLLYRPTSGGVHRLDPVGSVVWRLLDGDATVDELVGDLAAAFAADPTVVRADVHVLVEGLAEASLLAGGPDAEPQARPGLLTNPPSP